MPRTTPDNLETFRRYNLAKAGLCHYDYDNLPAWLVDRLALLDSLVSDEIRADMKVK
jgi:hypothetical protein